MGPYVLLSVFLGPPPCDFDEKNQLQFRGVVVASQIPLMGPRSFAGKEGNPVTPLGPNQKNLRGKVWGG